jgi:ParB-like chromosome segregation protein Spo0J
MSTQQYAANEVAWLQPDIIEDSPFQPLTRSLSEDEQREFDTSVKEHGVLHPGLVHKHAFWCFSR